MTRSPKPRFVSLSFLCRAICCRMIYRLTRKHGWQSSNSSWCWYSSSGAGCCLKVSHFPAVRRFKRNGHTEKKKTDHVAKRTTWFCLLGDLTRDQLSQLLLVYIGTAADIIEFFDSFKDEKIAQEPILVLLTLAIWSWSLLQFTVVLTATKSRKARLSTATNISWVQLVTKFLFALTQDSEISYRYTTEIKVKVK